MSATPNFDKVLADAAPLIDARVVLTGRPRRVYETWLTCPPRPGQSWKDAIYGRLESLKAGLLPPLEAERLRRQVQATSAQRRAA